MDWKTVHSYAEEIALWSTLTVNVWLILSGIIFIGLRIRNTPTSIEAQLARSLIAGILGGTSVLPILAIIAWIIGKPFLSILWTVVVVAVWTPLAIAGVRVNMWLEDEDKKNQKI